MQLSIDPRACPEGIYKMLIRACELKVKRPGVRLFSVITEIVMLA